MWKMILFTSFLASSSWANGQMLGSFSVGNSNFKDLYNHYRMQTPINRPWAGSYWSYRNDGIAFTDIYDFERRELQNHSPAEIYDQFWKIDQNAENAAQWEGKNHSCSQFNDDPETKESCDGWWGHCNAWSAAAIKKEEPRHRVVVSNRDGMKFELSVADQKGLMTELWMSSGSLFVGTTKKGVKTGDWIFNPQHPQARQRNRSGKTNYDAFWDISPKTFFLIFTNYVGIQRTGIVIDRFTGDQVWNQPVVGYRILPIRKEDILSSPEGITSVNMRMKIYWAEDGVHENTVSDIFDLKNTNDRDDRMHMHFGKHFTGRLLRFSLNFDGPVVLDEKGDIEQAGNLIGEDGLASGVWYHRTPEGRKFYASQGVSMDETHPDFIWLPTEVSAYSGSRNPWVQERYVDNILSASVVAEENIHSRNVVFVVKEFAEEMKGLKKLEEKKQIKYVSKVLSGLASQLGVNVNIDEELSYVKEKNMYLKAQVIGPSEMESFLSQLSSFGVNVEIL